MLVVEDNPVNQDVATGILENMGCTVATAPNGYAAVQRCAQDAFDLILMDCEMPVMDGFDATRRIREIERVTGGLRGTEGRSRIPIVALTAHALAEVRDRCLESGMDDFLVKPFDEQQMVDMLGRWLTPHAITTIPDTTATRTAQSPPPAGAAIDMAAVEKIRAIGRAGKRPLLGRIVAQFAETSPPLVVTMREGCAAGDTEAVWRAAHSLKSSSAAVGASGVAQRCAQIEAMAREHRILPPNAVIAAIDDELGIAIKHLRKLVEDEVRVA